MNLKLVLGALVLLIFGMGSLLYSSLEESKVGGDVPAPALSKGGLQDMPRSTNSDYFFKEAQLIGQMVAEADVISRNETLFQNSARKNYDIEERYQEFNEDMTASIKQIHRIRNRIAELDPATEEAKRQQKETLKITDRLLARMEKFEEHEDNTHDTLVFLTDCSMDVQRLQQQAQVRAD